MAPLADLRAGRAPGLPALERGVEDGIERVRCVPAGARGPVPLLFVHGMWHGAWCWEEWQLALAQLGWESIAFSLPGHGASRPGRPARWSTLGYYERALRAEIARLPARPVLIGHSMGGGLVQRLLKHADAFPAAVMIAPFLARQMASVILDRFRRDPWGALLSILSLTTTPCIRSDELVRRMFLSRQATCSPRFLRERLSPESLLVIAQHNPPFWRPPRRLRTPLLWLAPERDALMPEPASRRSAGLLGAHYERIDGAGHDLMFDFTGPDAVQRIHDWLDRIGLAPRRDALEEAAAPAAAPAPCLAGATSPAGRRCA